MSHRASSPVTLKILKAHKLKRVIKHGCERSKFELLPNRPNRVESATHEVMIQVNSHTRQASESEFYVDLNLCEYHLKGLKKQIKRQKGE